MNQTTNMQKETSTISYKKEEEIFQDVQEFLNLSRKFMRQLDLLKVINLPGEYRHMTEVAANKVGEKAFLYISGGSYERFM